MQEELQQSVMQEKKKRNKSHDFTVQGEQEGVATAGGPRSNEADELNSSGSREGLADSDENSQDRLREVNELEYLAMHKQDSMQ